MDLQPLVSPLDFCASLTEAENIKKLEPLMLYNEDIVIAETGKKVAR
jgi:hypothetical protein